MVDKKNTASILAKIRQKMQRIEKPEDHHEDSVAVVDLSASNPANKVPNQAGSASNTADKSTILSDDDIFLRDEADSPAVSTGATAPKMENKTAAIPTPPAPAAPIAPTAPTTQSSIPAAPAPAKSNDGEEFEFDENFNPIKKSDVKTEEKAAPILPPMAPTTASNNSAAVPAPNTTGGNTSNNTATAGATIPTPKAPETDLPKVAVPAFATDNTKPNDLELEFNEALKSQNENVTIVNTGKINGFDDLDSINLDDLDNADSKKDEAKLTAGEAPKNNEPQATSSANAAAPAKKDEFDELDQIDLDELDKQDSQFSKMIEKDQVKLKSELDQISKTKLDNNAKLDAAPKMDSAKEVAIKPTEISNNEPIKKEPDIFADHLEELHEDHHEEHHDDHMVETELHELDDLDELLAKPQSAEEKKATAPQINLKHDDHDDIDFDLDSHDDHHLDHELDHELDHHDDINLDDHHFADNLNTNIISQKVASQATSSLRNLVNAIPKKHEILLENQPAFRSGETIEGMVMNILAPKLEQWCNENLSNLVEKVVREEVKKLIPKD